MILSDWFLHRLSRHTPAIQTSPLPIITPRALTNSASNCCAAIASTTVLPKIAGYCARHCVANGTAAALEWKLNGRAHPPAVPLRHPGLQLNQELPDLLGLQSGHPFHSLLDCLVLAGHGGGQGQRQRQDRGARSNLQVKGSNPNIEARHAGSTRRSPPRDHRH
jgi:hypothetical protein